jgi:hypothetical protein
MLCASSATIIMILLESAPLSTLLSAPFWEVRRWLEVSASC